MQDQIRQSLNEFSQQQIFPINDKLEKHRITRYKKSNSFSQLSDWNNKHRYLNQSITLPRINQSFSIQKIQRQAKSQSSDYQDLKKQQSHLGMKQVQIQFGLPNGLKGFQKSFYENYLKEKSNKYMRAKPSQYLHMQDQGRRRSLDKKHNLEARTEREVAHQNIVNRIMNRKNRLKRQHFLDEFLTANRMGKKQQI